jgi:hypothetical protein
MRESRLPPIPKGGESDFAIVETTRIQALLQLPVRSEAVVPREDRSIGSARGHCFAVGPCTLRDGRARTKRDDSRDRDSNAGGGADDCRVGLHGRFLVEVCHKMWHLVGPRNANLTIGAIADAYTFVTTRAIAAPSHLRPCPLRRARDTRDRVPSPNRDERCAR